MTPGFPRSQWKCSYKTAFVYFSLFKVCFQVGFSSQNDLIKALIRRRRGGGVGGGLSDWTNADRANYSSENVWKSTRKLVDQLMPTAKKVLPKDLQGSQIVAEHHRRYRWGETNGNQLQVPHLTMEEFYYIIFFIQSHDSWKLVETRNEK